MSASIELEADTYRPGTSLRGEVRLEPARDEEGQRVELSVVWQASGGGRTDVGVVLYTVLCNGDHDAARATHAFEVALPALPLSYDGTTIVIGWYVRVRRLSLLGDDAIFDRPFTLQW